MIGRWDLGHLLDHGTLSLVTRSHYLGGCTTRLRDRCSPNFDENGKKLFIPKWFVFTLNGYSS